ncbi:DUF6640 family protein [Streptomyces silvisoli]|uniref:Acetyltransferase n=1 Tax=Streptomyces silvisoli TaxID=3034235 RepID=A0ABT5ZVM2_9ACTN|nr:DUF6640 family protein [Streptomyces silvisoli]MDF3293869.1 acetyltransferase [Streptomyces silvisoli]
MPRIQGRLGIGKVLISLVAVESAIGPYKFDWNETHIYNPVWPPHAKFHNAQTMSMGAALGGASLWHLWKGPRDTHEALDAAAICAALYWVTNISALFYPGSKAVDPPGTARFPQAKFAVPSLALVALGYLMERRRLG